MSEQKDGGPAPLTPEAVAQMVADREAGTPGPWREAQTWRPPIGNGPHSDMVNGSIFWGYSISGSNENGGHIYPTLAAVHNFPDHVHANARRIARLPDLEAAYLTLAAENATLRAERDALTERATDAELNWANCIRLAQRLRASEAAALARVTTAFEIAQTRHIPDQPAAYGGSELEWAQRQYASLRRDIIAALTPTADKEPKT